MLVMLQLQASLLQLALLLLRVSLLLFTSLMFLLSLQPTVANVLDVSSYCCCWLLPACCCRRNYFCKGLFFYGVSSVLAVLLLLSFLLLLAFLLLCAVMLYCTVASSLLLLAPLLFLTSLLQTYGRDGLRFEPGTQLAAVWLADNLATPHPNDTQGDLI